MFPFPLMPANTKDPYFSSVVALVGMNGTNGSASFIDEGPAARTVTTNGNAIISNEQTLFNRNTGRFDGTGDFVTLADNSAFSVANTVSKTIEVWFNITVSNKIGTLWNKRPSSSAHEFSLQTTATNTLQFAVFASGNSVLTISTSTNLSSGVWYHTAAVRTTAGAWTLYLDGAIIGSGTESATPTSSTAVVNIGRDGFDTTRDFGGFIAEARYTNAARYTAPFSRPSSAFPRS